MTGNNILQQLQAVYSAESLNFLASRLIEAYRMKDHDFFQNLARALNTPSYDQSGRLFNELIMMVHPDRQTYHTGRIRQLYSQDGSGNHDEYARILKLDRFIKSYRADASGKTKSSGAANASNRSEDVIRRRPHPDSLYDFLSALKQKEYGNLDVSYHQIDLENTEGDLELSGYGISDLSGLEYCIHIIQLDLSNNLIGDIHALSSLFFLESIDLSGNRITHLNDLTEMQYLRTLNIAFNEVEDILPLFDLERLEFLNCIGNPVPESRINELRKKGVIVIS